jgi:alkanesulfonate monooxygenase SsuD/methylene tetrahydromethanopterin reductase-like flavin-dependent oxidoreductase (luciferase family)
VSAACDAIGRDPSSIRRSLLTKAIVGTDEHEVRRRAEALMVWTGESGEADAHLNELRATHVAGTVEQVIERLAEYAAAGIQRVLLHQLVHEDLESIELIGREVVPAVAAFR